jgi:hypothetical protein
MKTASKALQDKALKTACRYRASEGLPSVVQEKFRWDAQRAFDKLVNAMKCTPEEKWMVTETLGRMVLRAPRVVLEPGKDY